MTNYANRDFRARLGWRQLSINDGSYFWPTGVVGLLVHSIFVYTLTNRRAVCVVAAYRCTFVGTFHAQTELHQSPNVSGLEVPEQKGVGNYSFYGFSILRLVKVAFNRSFVISISLQIR